MNISQQIHQLSRQVKIVKSRQRKYPPSPKVKLVKMVVKQMSVNPTQPFHVKIVKMVKIVKSRIANTPPSPKVKIVKIVVKQMSVNPTHPYQVKIVKIVKSRKANTSNQFRNSRKY